MVRKVLMSSLSLVLACCLTTWAADANDCIQLGRAYLFDGTLSGVRLAYQTFDDCLNDPTCPDCTGSRELKFLHAVTHTAMLVIGDDAGSTDSVFELMERFGIDIIGDYWAPYFDPCDILFVAALNEHDAYEIPPGAPDAREIRGIIDANMIPEIDAIIAELNSISDSPGDRFRMYLDPNEVAILFDPNVPRLANPVEVDYGEVLILKGMLMGIRTQLLSQLAYDIYVDSSDMLAEKVYGSSFSINDDLLEPHPELLNVLPTANDSNDGAAILAQARDGWIASINYYFDAIDYISNEDNPPDDNDPQEDEFIYIDPNYHFQLDAYRDLLTTLRESLTNDTSGAYPQYTTRTYGVYDAGPSLIGELVLVWDPIPDEGDGGSLSFTDPGITPSQWEVDDLGLDNGNKLWVDVDYFDGQYYRFGWMEAILAADGSSFTAGSFTYIDLDWSWVTLTGLSGQLVTTEVVDANINFNPVFGSSPNYPNPVNPRDLLPAFDQWNGPQPGTMGHGLGDDATLGGIFPDMNQEDWQRLFAELQPGGIINLAIISPGDVIIDGETSDWTSAQLVLADVSGDTDEDPAIVSGVDLKELYLARDSQYLYGAITFYDNITTTNYYMYELFLTYSQEEDWTLDSIFIKMEVSNGIAYGDLYVLKADCYFPFLDHITSFETEAGLNAVEFKVPLADINLPGRFISLETGGWDPILYEWNDDWNQTHLKIRDGGTFCTINGTVAYADYSGVPIFVQAYTDPWEPEESLVASTMITAPGPYTLEGIGLGWQGYVRAFTPLFGLNIFDWDALAVQASAPVSVTATVINGVDLVLTSPTLLEKDVWVGGVIGPDSTETEEDWYAFDAIEGGTYILDLGSHFYGAHMTLYGRDGDTDLQEPYFWQTQHITWICPVTGRYYVSVADDFCPSAGGTYQIRMTHDLPPLPVHNATQNTYYDTIQAAINEAVDLDIIVVQPGTYYENINFATKNIILTSTNPGDSGVVNNTVIDGSYKGPTVIFAGGQTSACAIKGFTITRGYYSLGGGILNLNSSPTILDCVLSGNIAAQFGGAMLNINSNPTVSRCTFTGNIAAQFGGGIMNINSSPTLGMCRLTNNWAVQLGGGMLNMNGGNPTLTNCVLSSNGAFNLGGAMFNLNCSPTLTNCTVSYNLAAQFGAGLLNYQASPELKNCIIWGNIDTSSIKELSQVLTISGTPSVTYSCIQDDNPDDASIPFGDNNIDDNPTFQDALYHLLAGSPCIDAGDPTSDYSNEPMPNGARINMGAYGNTAEAAASSG